MPRAKKLKPLDLETSTDVQPFEQVESSPASVDNDYLSSNPELVALLDRANRTESRWMEITLNKGEV